MPAFTLARESLLICMQTKTGGWAGGNQVAWRRGDEKKAYIGSKAHSNALCSFGPRPSEEALHGSARRAIREHERTKKA